MSKGFGLEDLRKVFEDRRQHIALAKITSLSLADDRSFLKCTVMVFPEMREIVARMSWDSVGDGSGLFSFPSVNDMVLIAFADGEVDHCYVIRRLTSKEDKIPLQAVDGSTALIALSGKKMWVTSDTRINLSKGSDTPTENLVLGQVLKDLLSDLIQKVSDLADEVSSHTHAGNLGYPTSPPTNPAPYLTIKSDLDGLKASPVDDSLILSDIAFTEKGN
jgi:hypothetical protein